MCDTVFKMAQGVTYFAKNSDREPDEAQYVEYYPHTSARNKVKATYINVDYEGEANAIIISRPHWMWGAEMGVNEKGVAIGNEAIFSKVKHKEKSLLGMDILRLGLEKGDSAREAAQHMIYYIEKYGIGGSNSYRRELYYDNSFLITDREEAYVLETEGKEYTLEKIGPAGSISNFPAFRKYRLNNLYTNLGKGSERQKRTDSVIRGVSDLAGIMELMRLHHDGFTHPRNGNNGDICMHGGFLSRRYQTANSFVVELRSNFSVIWTTYSSNPCVSLYEPIIFKDGSIIGSPFYEKDYWRKALLRHYQLFRGSDEDYNRFRLKISEAQDLILSRFSRIREELISTGSVTEEDLKDFYEYLGSLHKEVELEEIELGQKIGTSFTLYGLWLKSQMQSLAI